MTESAGPSFRPEFRGRKGWRGGGLMESSSEEYESLDNYVLERVFGIIQQAMAFGIQLVSSDEM